MKGIQKMQRWESWKHLKALKIHFWGFKFSHLQYPKLKNLLPKYLHVNNGGEISQTKYAPLNNEMQNYQSVSPGELQFAQLRNEVFPRSLVLTPIGMWLFP